MKLLILAWVTSATIILIAYLLRPENRFVLGSALLLAIIVLVLFIRERLRRKREGFYITTKGNADGGDVIYHEGDKSLTFYFDRTGRTVYVPSNRKWEGEMPDWAKRRKMEIIERVAKRMGKGWKCQDETE